MKEGEVGAEAAREISKLTAEMFTIGNDSEDDSGPFTSCDEELETSEFVVNTMANYVKTNLTCTHNE